MLNRSSRYEMDMTQGALLPKVLLYTAPLMLSGILQLLFNAADLIVVGKFAGKESLAAVGSTGSLINLLVNVFMGLSVGGSVAVATAYGARDQRAVRDAVHTSIALAIIGGFAVGALGALAARPILELMDSPEDVIDLAALYVKIYFMGMPLNMLYTFGSAVLRAVGDTRRPLYYLTIAGVVNVLLNLLMVIVFRMGVAGVALATVASQGISAALVIRCLCRSTSVIRLNLRKLRIDRTQLVRILKVGLPAGVQGSLFSISNVLIQSSVNSFQSVAMAGNSASSNLEGFVYTAMNAVHQAALTFAGQNVGAGMYKRTRKVLFTCLGTVAAVGLCLGFLFRLLGTPLLSLYNSDPEVIAYGLRRMSIILPTYFICGMMDVMVGQLRGMGSSILPMIVSLTGACLLRIVWIYTVFQADRTLEVLYWSYPVSWTVTFACHFVCYLFIVRKFPRTDRNLEEAVA